MKPERMRRYAWIPELKLRQMDIYRSLGLTQDKKVQGGDIVSFVEMLISLTEAREIFFKKLDKNSIFLELSFHFSPEEKSNPINPVDSWCIRVDRMFNIRRKLFGLYSVKEKFFHIKVINKFRHFPEDIGEWKTTSDARDILAMRLDKLMEIEMLKVSMNKKDPAERKEF